MEPGIRVQARAGLGQRSTSWRAGPPLLLVALLVLTACAGGSAPGGGGSIGAAASAAAQGGPSVSTPPRMVVNNSARNGAQAPIWLAYESGLFREQGLEVELTNINSSSRVLQAMVAGEVHLSTLDPATAVQASLEGGDVVLLFAAANRLIFSVLTQPSLQQPQALRGKVMGITRIGSSAHTAALVALESWGLAPDRDVSLRQLGDAAAILAGLQAGQIDAGVISSPTSSRARQAGYHEMINLNTNGPEYPAVAVGGRRAWIAANEEAVRRFARAYVLGIQRFQTDKPAALEMYSKYMKIDDAAVLEDTYAQFSASFAAWPYISEPGFARLLEDLAGEDPRLAGRQPSEWLEGRYLRELEAAGFLQGASSTAR